MQYTLPGTVLSCEEEAFRTAFSVIQPILAATGGLTLSQVVDMTGLPASTIQNWIKRGWVASPASKRYGERQLMRILLINMLRSSIQLEQIQVLMRYVNGKVDDESDDAIADRDLYNMLCAILFKLSRTIPDEPTIRLIIEQELASCKTVLPADKQKLATALYIMTLGYLSAMLQEQMNKQLGSITS